MGVLGQFRLYIKFSYVKLFSYFPIYIYIYIYIHTYIYIYFCRNVFIKKCVFNDDYPINIYIIYIYIYIDGIHHWTIITSSYRKLAWMGFEPTTTEFRSDALTNWTIRPWINSHSEPTLYSYSNFIVCSVSNFISAIAFVSWPWLSPLRR